MAEPSIAPTFSALPTEMKVGVFRPLLQNNHRKSACLVSRDWRDLMAPFLWEKLTLRVANTLPGDLACLLKPDNGVLAHVRIVTISTELDNNMEFDMNSEFGIAFKLIIGALPRNCLSTIRVDTAISVPTLLSLLQSQQTLQILQLRRMVWDTSSSFSPNLAIHGSWVTPMLRNIRHLRIPIVYRKGGVYENNAYLLKNTPELKALSLKGYSNEFSFRDSHGHDAFGAPGAAGQNLQLDYLELCRLDLKTYPASIFTAIDFSTLLELSVAQCRNVGAFLTALAPGASRVPALKKLKITLDPSTTPSDADVQAIETLLRATSSIKRIWLDTGKGRLIDVACLAGHRNSLKRLALAASSRMQGRHHNGLELDQLQVQAPNLVHLAINFCPINLGHARYRGANFKLLKKYDGDYVLNEIESLLIPITKHQNLKMLRIFTPPSIDYGMYPDPDSLGRVVLPEEHVYTSQAIMQAFVTEVFRLLAGNGSNIRALAMAPEHGNCIESPVSDGNGHRWPCCYYRYGVTRAMNGQEHIVAVPVHPMKFQLFKQN